MLKPEWLRHEQYGLTLNPPCGDSFSGVVLDDCIYVRGSEGSILKYPLKFSRKSWSILKTPEEAVAEYTLTEYSNNLVFVGGCCKEHRVWSDKVWVHNRSKDQWEDDLVPPVPWSEPSQAPAQHVHCQIMSAFGSHDLLIILYKLHVALQDESRARPYNVICKPFVAKFHTFEWKSPCPGPPLDRYDKARIITHNYSNTLYAMICNGQQATLYKAQVSTSEYEIGEWTPLLVAGGAYISSHPSMTILENKLIVTGLSSLDLVLLTPFPDVKGKMPLVDIDELNVDFKSVECIIGRPDRTLLVIGYAKKEDNNVSSVIGFNQKGTFTI